MSDDVLSCLAFRLDGPDHPPFLCTLPVGHNGAHRVVLGDGEAWEWPKPVALPPSATRFTGLHFERGLWWFRVRGYGLHYCNTRRHRPVHALRCGVGPFRHDLHVGRFIIGPMLPLDPARG